jgi:heme/copper-type cytochrome/quinol oxidase subunit 2
VSGKSEEKFFFQKTTTHAIWFRRRDFSANNKNMTPISTMTPMKNRLYITIILSALLLSVAVQSVLAQEIMAGVAPGNEFTYDVTSVYPSGNPNVPQDVIDGEATDYFRLVIKNVTGPEIGYDWVWHFTNGTDDLNGDGTLNVETTGYVGPFWAILSANLSRGDRIHPHYGPDRSTVNETLRWTYTNYTRETNRLQLEFAYRNNVTQALKTERTDTYFDKRTGMLVQLNDEISYQNPTFTTTVKWELRETNAWDSTSPGSFQLEPFFSLPLIIAIVVVVAVLVAIGAWALSNQRTKARRKELLKKK